MGKLLKILGIVAGALVLLLVLAVSIIPLVVPWGSMVTGALEDSLGRKATVEEVSVSLWGGLEAEVKGLVVADKPAYGQRPLIKLGSLKVQVSLWPLLTKNLVVDKTQVDGLELSVVRGKDGRLNWRDLPPREKGKAERRDRRHEKDDDDGHMIVRALSVTGSRVFLLNQANGLHSELPLERCTLSSDLTTRGIAGQVALALPGFSLESVAKSRAQGDSFALEPSNLSLKLDLAQVATRLAPVFPGLKARGVVEISGRAQGPAKALAIQAQGRASGLWLQTRAMGKRYFSLQEVTLGADLILNLPGETAEVKGASLRAPQAGFLQHLSGRLGWGDSRGKCDAQFQQQVDLAKLAQVISPLLPWTVRARGLVDKAIRCKGLGPKVLEISGQNRGKDIFFKIPPMAAPFQDAAMRADYVFIIDGKQDQFEIKRLQIESAVARLNLTGKLAKHGEKALLRLSLKGDYLDLDRLPLGAPSGKPGASPAKAKAKAPAKAPAPGKAAPTGSQDSRGPDTAKMRRDLQSLDAAMEVKLGLLRANGYELKNLALKATVKQAKAVLEEFKAGFLQGNLDMNAQVDFNPTPPASGMKMKGERLHITPPMFRKLKNDFPLFALPLSGLSGVFSLDSELAGQGLTAPALAASLKGKGSLKARDGVTVEYAFLDQVSGLGSLLQGALGDLPRRFAVFEGNYTVGQGKVNYDIALKADNDELSAAIVGNTGLLDGSLDATLKFDAQTVGHTLRQFLAPDGTFPIKLGGTIHQPVPKLALGGAPVEKAVEGLIKGLFNK